MLALMPSSNLLTSEAPVPGIMAAVPAPSPVVGKMDVSISLVIRSISSRTMLLVRISPSFFAPAAPPSLAICLSAGPPGMASIRKPPSRCTN